MSNGNDNYNANTFDEFDPYTMQLLEALGEALGKARIEIRCEREAVEAKLLERLRDLQATGKNLERELKTPPKRNWPRHDKTDANDPFATSASRICPRSFPACGKL